MNNPFIFNASGECIGSMHIRGNVFLILVHTASAVDPFCVALYQSGSTEWESGAYYENRERAIERFTDRLSWHFKRPTEDE